MEGNYYSTPGKKMTKQNPNYGIRHPIKTSKGIKKDDEMYDRVDNKFSERRKDGIHDKHVYNSSNTKADKYRADDARYRHARRHPEQYKESVIQNPDLL